MNSSLNIKEILLSEELDLSLALRAVPHAALTQSGDTQVIAPPGAPSPRYANFWHTAAALDLHHMLIVAQPGFRLAPAQAAAPPARFTKHVLQMRAGA